ncbi:MAG TPA: cytochrome c [Thermoanaerobaculia bacterium]|nr:cytochrome c [Thermoanaerobaculia bacterium]
MSWAVVLPVVAALVLLRLLPVRVNPLLWIAAWWLALWVIFDFGFAVPIPASVVKLFMGIVTLAALAYLTADPQRLQEAKRPTLAFLTERRFLPLLLLVALAIPAAVATNIYRDMTAPPQPPFFGRTIHPAPPNQITVHDRVHDLTTLENPFREVERRSPQQFASRVADGRRVYYQNCFYCHGDLMLGEGIYAPGLNPIPTNFQDTGTIAQLQESFLFWRVAKGGPGLPEEAGPWMSAMPAWEQFLSEDEMWNVILFLYEFTGQRPRARHAVESITE